MMSAAKLLRLLVELIFVLLGSLLAWVAVTGRYFFNRRAPAWIALGAFLIYWGSRAGLRARRNVSRAESAASAVRSASLVVVGALMLGIAGLPFPWVGRLMGLVAGTLVVRGIVSTTLFARLP